MFSQIKDRKHIEQNFHSVARVMPRVGLVGAGGVKNFSVGMCDSASSTARSRFAFVFRITIEPGPEFIKRFLLNSTEHEIYPAHKHYNCWHFNIISRINTLF